MRQPASLNHTHEDDMDTRKMNGKSVNRRVETRVPVALQERRAKLHARVVELGDLLNDLDALMNEMHDVNEVAWNALNDAWSEVEPQFCRATLAYVAACAED